LEKYSGAGQATDGNMAYARCKSTHTHTHTHTEHVILIAFPLQQWLNECASVLRHTYSTLPVLFRYAQARDRVRLLVSPDLFPSNIKVIQIEAYTLTTADLIG
jgi:hypothetical protein